ncbi:toll-like receptor 2 [Anabrus simplex]|uniref:toll-like receptor 2 n=1 Tax=Anabrus simplex TaxID=316456 RepID=UPI0035A2A827
MRYVSLLCAAVFSGCFALNLNEFISFLQSSSKLLDIDLEPRFTSPYLYLDYSKASGKYILNIQLEFYVLPLTTQENVSIMALGLQKAVVLSEVNGSQPVTLKVQTNKDVPVGVLGINNTCFLSTGQFVECRAFFQLTWDLINTEMLLYSPFMEEFWASLQDRKVPYANWIQTITLETHYGSLPSTWVSRMDLSSLTELVISGNTWRRPQNLIGNLPNLQRLLLMNNSIEELPNDTLLKAPRVKFLHLALNNLTRLPLYMSNVTGLIISEQEGRGPLKITDEQILTLKNMENIQLNSHLEANISTFLELPKILRVYCSNCLLKHFSYGDAPLAEESSVVDIHLNSNNLTSLPTEIFRFLKRLSSMKLDSNQFVVCPCNAFSTLKRLRHLTMSNNKITHIPAHCFSNLTSLTNLDLSSNAISFVHDSAFENTSNLMYLQLRHNFLTSISPPVLLPLNSLVRLDLSNNRLKKTPIFGRIRLAFLGMSNNLLSTVTNLTSSVKYILHLDLSGNIITELRLETVNYLNLSHNSLSHIDEEMRKCLENLTTLDLGGNNFDCCHRDILVLRELVNTSRKGIRNLGTYEPLTCVPKAGKARVLLKAVIDDTLCFEESSYLAVEIAVPLAILFTCILVFFAARKYYSFQFSYVSHFVKMKKRRFVVQEDIQLSECVYDAFVCYSGKNLQWIIQQLIPTLENGSDKYRFCIHDRDFAVGAPIDKNIMESLQKSRRVIFVLTKDFLKSTWCQWEMNMANHRTFKQDRDYIILLEMEDLDHDNLPSHLQYLIDSRTYIKWPQDPTDLRQIQKCWQKLKIVLGDSLFKKTGRGPPKGTVLDP